MHRALRLPAVLSCLALAATSAHAQTRPIFEVASIRPAAPLDMAKVRNGEVSIGPRVDGARAEFLYMTLQDLISLSYKVKADQITGPDWIASQRFDIFAKLPDGASKNDLAKMVQALLEDRFKLAIHHESKGRRALVLVVGTGGPNMKEPPEVPALIDANAPLAPGEKQVDGPGGPVRMTTDRNGGFTMNMASKGILRYGIDPANRSMKIEASRVTMCGFAEMLTTLMRATGGGLDVKGYDRPNRTVPSCNQLLNGGPDGCGASQVDR